MSQGDTEPDKHKIKIFDTDMGINAKVERHEVVSEAGDRAQRMLRDMGKSLNPTDYTEYMGSYVIHLYESTQLKHLMYVKQSVRDREIPEVVASKAFEDLKHHIMSGYGRKPGTKRSGF